MTSLFPRALLCSSLALLPTLVLAQAPPAAAPALSAEGCVSKDDRRDGSSVATQFVLTDRAAARPSPPAAGATSPGAMTAGTPAPVRKAYVLRTDQKSVDLATYVGRMVRVTGHSTAAMTTAPLAGRSPEATPNPAPAAAPGATGSDFDTANLPTLVVATITTIGAACK